MGYTCYGPIALTAASFDLYWIAVDKSLHGRKIGRLLLEKTEELIRQAGGRQVYIETSNRHHYAATRGFYLRCGYRQEALLEDFYAPGDDKVIYVKELGVKPRAEWSRTNGRKPDFRLSSLGVASSFFRRDHWPRLYRQRAHDDQARADDRQEPGE